MWDASSSSRRRQRPIGFPPELRLVHPAHPFATRYASREEQSWQFAPDLLPRGAARSRSSAPRRRPRRSTTMSNSSNLRSPRHRAPSSLYPAAAATKAVAALASDAHLVPPRRRRSCRAATGGGASSRTGRSNRAYFVSASSRTLKAERTLSAAIVAPRLATGAEPTQLASFWHVHPLRVLRCSGSATHA